MSVEPSPFSGYPFVIDPDAPRGQVFLMRPVDPLHGEEVAEPTFTFTEWFVAAALGTVEPQLRGLDGMAGEVDRTQHVAWLAGLHSEDEVER